MKILDCHKYKDGGTIVVDTDNGRYWLPHDSIGIWKGPTYFRDDQTIVVDNEEEISNFIKALAEDSQSLQWIKRHLK